MTWSSPSRPISAKKGERGDLIIGAPNCPPVSLYIVLKAIPPVVCHDFRWQGGRAALPVRRFGAGLSDCPNVNGRRLERRNVFSDWERHGPGFALSGHDLLSNHPGRGTVRGARVGLRGVHPAEPRPQRHDGLRWELHAVCGPGHGAPAPLPLRRFQRYPWVPPRRIHVRLFESGPVALGGGLGGKRSLQGRSKLLRAAPGNAMRRARR
mmetsp:Transcript_10607/g.24695  ORF Transcript_10607/g.24695 Transcript_10607/m.24695 type:complete len:209 (-) Transcript_10607:1594-2220(-)